MSGPSNYIPAFRFNLLTPLFDPMARWLMRELTFKRRLIEEADIAPASRVLDLGSGTGTLTILVKQMHPTADVVGIDGDPNILAISRAKAPQRHVDVRFDEGLASELPYPDASFDRVLSSLVFHHLTTENKERTLREILRVLKPGGALLIVDFGRPQNALAGAMAQLAQHLEPTGDLSRGILPEFLRRAGFEQVQVVTQFMTSVGSLSLYRGQKPSQ